MRTLFLTLLQMSLAGAAAAVFVLPIRLLLRRAPKKWSYLLWLPVLFRFVSPAGPRTAFEASYRKWLGVGHWFLPDAVEILEYLKARGYRLYIASNGVIDTQYSRLESAGIGPFFDGIFISEEIGFHKPQKAYFDACFARIPDFAREEAVLIGDSLSSDIRGAKNAGIASIWLNRNGRTAPPEHRPDYEIHSLRELCGIL